jgi:hypothetical protein
VAWALSPAGFTPLLPRQHQQFGVGGQHFSERVLELVTGLDTPAYFLDPLFRDAFHTSLAAGHERQGPGRMALPLGTVTGRFATPSGTEGQGTRQQILGEGKTPQESELPLPPTRGKGAFGVAGHLEAIMLQEQQKNKRMFRMRK